MSSVSDNNLKATGVNDNSYQTETAGAHEVNAKEIQVEDPVNFLNLQEKQEYMLAHQETIARGEVPLDKLSDLPRPGQVRAQTSGANDVDRLQQNRVRVDSVDPRHEDRDTEYDSFEAGPRREEAYFSEEEAKRAVPRHSLQQKNGQRGSEHREEHETGQHGSERGERHEIGQRGSEREERYENEQRSSERREEYEKRSGSPAVRERQEDEEVRYRDYDDRSAVEKGLSVAVKFGLVAIIILLLTMVILFFLPSVKRAIGMGESGETAGTGLTLPQEDLQASQSVTGESSEGQQTQTEPPIENPVEGKEPQGGNPETRTVTVTADTLNLRDLPGWMEGSEVVCKVKKGDQLEVADFEEGWLKVFYEGRELYCSEDYVE